MNIQDFHSWMAQIDLISTVEECNRAIDTLYASPLGVSRTYWDLLASEQACVDALIIRRREIERGPRLRLLEEAAAKDIQYYEDAAIWEQLSKKP